MTWYVSNFRITRGTGFQTRARPGHAIAGADIANSAAGGGPSNCQHSNTEKATETVTGTETGTGTDRARDRDCGTGRDSLSDSDKGRLRDREGGREGGREPCRLKPPPASPKLGPELGPSSGCRWQIGAGPVAALRSWAGLTDSDAQP